MVSSRLTASLLESAPIALVAALSAWAFGDFLGIPATPVAQGLALVLLIGWGALLLGLRFRYPSFRRAGLTLFTLSYLGAHLFALPLEPAAALGFLTLVLLAVELRILGERFAPILRSDLDEDAHARVREALVRCAVRLAAAAALGFFGSTLAADLALSGALPLRSIATALLLSMGLVAVVLLLALWPLLEPRMVSRAEPEVPIQTAK